MSEEDRVKAWLDSVGARYGEKYGDALLSEGFDCLEEFRDLESAEELKKCGLKNRHAKKIFEAAQNLDS